MAQVAKQSLNTRFDTWNRAVFYFFIFGPLDLISQIVWTGSHFHKSLSAKSVPVERNLPMSSLNMLVFFLSVAFNFKLWEVIHQKVCYAAVAWYNIAQNDSWLGITVHSFPLNEATLWYLDKLKVPPPPRSPSSVWAFSISLWIFSHNATSCATVHTSLIHLPPVIFLVLSTTDSAPLEVTAYQNASLPSRW